MPRSEVFITTKLWNNSHDEVQEALSASLKDLDTDYVDLYLMHWPVAFKSGGEAMPKDANGKIQNIDVDYVDVSNLTVLCECLRQAPRSRNRC